MKIQKIFWLLRLLTFCSVIVLGGCGGGSQQVQLEAANVALMVSSGANIVTQPGASNVFSIVGGGGGKTYTTYSVTSNNSSIVTASIVGAKLTVTGVSYGTANVLVSDSSGATFTIAISIPKVSEVTMPLAVSAPASVLLSKGENPVYEIIGGKPPYRATSAAAKIVFVEVKQNLLLMTGVSQGNAVVNVRDADGTVIVTSVTVAPEEPKVKLYGAIPAAVSVMVGAAPVYKIAGGFPPYSAVSSTNSVAQVEMVGDNLMVTGLNVGTSNIQIFDTTGASISTAVNVAAIPVAKAEPLKIAAPSTVNLGIGDSMNYTILGGTAPYKTVSANENIVSAKTSIDGNSNSIIVSAKNVGSGAVSLFDAKGETFSINFVVTNNVVVTPLFTTAPSNMTYQFGETNSYAIGGGTKPYSAVSSASGIVLATVTNGDTLNVKSLSSGSAVVFVRDASGTVIQTAINVLSGPQPTQLYSNAPSTVSLNKGASVTYTIGGGLAPYTVGSGAPGVVGASVSGTSLILNAVDSGTSIVSLRDSSGASVSISVTVNQPQSVKLFSTAPSSITIAVGASPSYTVSGGVAPYFITSSDASKFTTSIAGSSISLVAVSTGSGQATISDSAGGTINIAVTVGNGSVGPLYTDAPSSLSLVKGNSFTYKIGGGVAPYSVVSGAPNVVTGNVSGLTLSVSAIDSGNGTLTIRDANGSVVSVNVIVATQSQNKLFTTSPSSIALPVGGVSSFDIGGGSGPYAVVSGNLSVSTASLSGLHVTVTGIAPGASTIVVSDSTGSSISIVTTVTSNPVTPLYTDAPAAITINKGSSFNYKVGGGVGPYSVTSSAPNILTGSIVGSTLTVSAVDSGTGSLVIRDASGGLVNVGVVITAQSQTKFFTTSPTSISIQVGSSSGFDIGGGVGPYAVVSGNAAVASVVLSGTRVTVTGVKSGSSTVVVSDSTGTSSSISVTVNGNTVTPLYTDAPSALSLVKGNAFAYKVGGGVAPYTVASSAPGIITGSISGGTTVNITAFELGSGVLVLQDANGNSVNINVTVTAQTSNKLFTTSPSAITVAVGANPNFEIGGGLGPFTVVSSNPAIATVSITGSRFVVSGVLAGTASVVVSDSTGATVIIAVTVN